MPRPRLTDRPVGQKIYIPTSLNTRLQLFLFSEVESRVPHGALSKYVEGLIRADLDRRAKEQP
jgi:hypothetical protein